MILFLLQEDIRLSTDMYHGGGGGGRYIHDAIDGDPNMHTELTLCICKVFLLLACTLNLTVT